MKQKRARDLRSSRYTGSDDEWEAILRHFLLPTHDSGISTELRRSLETVAAITEKGDSRVLSITFRNRIDQITQKLGSIELKESEDEIQLFDWATNAVDHQRLLQNEVSTLHSRSEADLATITALKSQLADLIKAKAEHEEQLISKFALLLNEKKLKIRNQQRILSTAKVEEEKLAQLKLTLDGTSRRPGRAKRRAETTVEASDQEQDEGDGFETMNVDHMPNALGDARSSRETTPATETDSEDQGSAGQPATSPVVPESRNSKPSNTESETPPPPRPLPFGRKGATKTDELTKRRPAEAVLGSDEDTASEDDEL